MSEWTESSLFAGRLPRLARGRVRIGLDEDVTRARDSGHDLSAAGVATLRSLADQIDAVERMLRSPKAGPYDRVPLTGLVRQFDDTYDRVFAALRADTDPLARALAEFTAAEVRDTAGPGPTH